MQHSGMEQLRTSTWQSYLLYYTIVRILQNLPVTQSPIMNQALNTKYERLKMREWSWHILSYKRGICLGGGANDTHEILDRHSVSWKRLRLGMLIAAPRSSVQFRYVHRNTCNVVIQDRSVARQHTYLITALNTGENTPSRSYNPCIATCDQNTSPSFGEPFIQTGCRLSLLCMAQFKLYAFLLSPAQLHSIQTSFACTYLESVPVFTKLADTAVSCLAMAALELTLTNFLLVSLPTQH